MNVGSTSVNELTCFAGRSLKWMLWHLSKIGKGTHGAEILCYAGPGMENTIVHETKSTGDGPQLRAQDNRSVGVMRIALVDCA